MLARLRTRPGDAAGKEYRRDCTDLGYSVALFLAICFGGGPMYSGLLETYRLVGESDVF